MTALAAMTTLAQGSTVRCTTVRFGNMAIFPVDLVKCLLHLAVFSGSLQVHLLSLAQFFGNPRLHSASLLALFWWPVWDAWILLLIWVRVFVAFLSLVLFGSRCVGIELNSTLHVESLMLCVMSLDVSLLTMIRFVFVVGRMLFLVRPLIYIAPCDGRREQDDVRRVQVAVRLEPDDLHSEPVKLRREPGDNVRRGPGGVAPATGAPRDEPDDENGVGAVVPCFFGPYQTFDYERREPHDGLGEAVGVRRGHGRPLP
ncbi:unnamed protein product [Prorocentrum cordatum]|uniref:Transmembrane protein 138 n=1 Tax=Prorocentrum cordatum TaxID=2364126 RepID=A0ABN9XZV6_9DINO|nr:unnamed protein product [Polarella glacialis]